MTLGVLRERPTTSAPRDLSVPVPRASAAAGGLRVSEDELWRSYAAVVMRVERCLCGGLVVADPLDPARAVWAHNATDGHAAWAIAAGWR